MDRNGRLSTNARPGGESPSHVHVVGAGAWGTTLALLCSRTGRDVRLVTRNREAADVFRAARRHPRSLPGVEIPEHITIEHFGAHSIAAADIVILAIPVQAMRAVLAGLVPDLRGKCVLIASKGIEVNTLVRPSGIVRDVIGDSAQIAVLSGPNLSSEIAAGKPASTVIAANDLHLARTMAATVHSETFRTYLSQDVTGVELGGALKNIIAIGAGIADGLNAGDNARAALVTRGLAEIARLGIACGAEALTFAGLSGMGDLVATCASPLSRNHQVGVALAAGRSLDDIRASMVETAEGIATTAAAVRLAARHGVEMPIATEMHRVLFEGLAPADAIRHLMARDVAQEWRGSSSD